MPGGAKFFHSLYLAFSVQCSLDFLLVNFFAPR